LLFAAGIVATCIGINPLPDRLVIFSGERFGFGYTIDSLGFTIGAGRGDISSQQMEIHGVGQNVLGFVLKREWRASNSNGTGGFSQWIIFGLPWWFTIGLVFCRWFDRFACRWAATALENRRNREAVRTLGATAAFHRRPVCRQCGYDMRATLTRCPECGWIPDFPRPLNETRAANKVLKAGNDG